MNKNNAREQLYSLIEHFNNGGTNFNEKDIEAIKYLLEENKQLNQDYEKENYLVDKLTRQLTQEYKNTNNIVKKIKQYKDIIDELEEWLKKEIGKFEEYGASFGLTIDEEISEYITDRISGYKNTLKKLKELKKE